MEQHPLSHVVRERTAEDGGGQVVLRLVEASKTYPGVRALKGVSLGIEKGRVHALVGENGAGKSTLLKLVCGAERPTSGSIEIDGSEAVLHHPHVARRLGIAAVHQELTILPALSAMANVFLGQEFRSGPLLNARRMGIRYRELCNEFAVKIAPTAPGASLSVADQQMLEIMRGIQADARILVLDEPTASLAVSEREALYTNLRRLQTRGIAIALISHDLDEVLQLSDTISVLRDGELVRTAPASDWSKEGLVRAMLGRSSAVAEGEARRRPAKTLSDEVALSARNIVVPGSIRGVSIDIHRGEIVGLAGLVGAGRTETLRALAGLEPSSSGDLVVAGRFVRWPHTPRQAQRYGIALVPEDRKTQGLVQQLPAFANVTLANPWPAAIGPVLLPSKERSMVAAVTARVGFAKGRLSAQPRTLSGGNQQKIVLAKWIARNMPVLLVDEPTRGIDVGAKEEIFNTLHGLADAGTAILLVSSELEEVLEHSDKILVIAGGAVVDELDGARATQAQILERVFAVKDDRS